MAVTCVGQCWENGLYLWELKSLGIGERRAPKPLNDVISQGQREEACV